MERLEVYSKQDTYKGKCKHSCPCGGTLTTIGIFSLTGKANEYYKPEPDEMMSNIATTCDSCGYNEYS